MKNINFYSIILVYIVSIQNYITIPVGIRCLFIKTIRITGENTKY